MSLSRLAPSANRHMDKKVLSCPAAIITNPDTPRGSCTTTWQSHFHKAESCLRSLEAVLDILT